MANTEVKRDHKFLVYFMGQPKREDMSPAREA